MKTLYQSDNHWNHYRIRSARASWWDYGKNGRYYLTICTKHRFPFLGKVIDGKMELSKIGLLARELWQTLPDMSLPGVHLEALVISPNHIHGIVVLERDPSIEPIKTETDEKIGAPNSDDPTERSAFFKHISPKKGSLSHLVRKFKGLVTKAAREQGLLGKKEALWQPRYYDRIVRNTAELDRIADHLKLEVGYWESKKDDYYVHEPCIALQKPLKKGRRRSSWATPTMLAHKRRNHQTTSRRRGQIERRLLRHWLQQRFPNLYPNKGNAVMQL